MTITPKGDKIAPVADDGDLKPPKISSAGDAEAERPGSEKRMRETGSAEKKVLSSIFENVPKNF